MKKKNRIFPILGVLLAVLLVVMIVVLCLPHERPVGDYVRPEFDDTAVQGTPEVDKSLGYWELYQDGMAYRVAVCGQPSVDGKTLTVYFTNDARNEKYLKLRVLSDDGDILGETGVLRPGEYVQSVTLAKKVKPGAKLTFKVLSFEPSDYSSAGSILLNVKVAGTDRTWLRVAAIAATCAALALAAILLGRKLSHLKISKRAAHGKGVR